MAPYQLQIGGLFFALMGQIQSASAAADLHDNVTIYSQLQISQMQGQSALAIVEQVAGFQFIDSTTQRGLSNASGNVLINGLPVLNKTQSLEHILATLPAAQFETMEVYLAGHPFTSASQYTQVINLVRSQTRRQINWRAETGALAGVYYPKNLSVQTSHTWQGWDHQLQAGIEKDVLHTKSEISESDASDNTYLRGKENYNETMRNGNVSLVSAKALSDSYVQLNTQWRKQQYKERYDREWLQLYAASANETIQSIYLTEQVELGLDWQQQPGEKAKGWLWQFTGLLRQECSHENSLVNTLSDEIYSADIFTQRKTLTEQVMKLATQQPALWWHPELGVELSYNRQHAETLEQTALTATVREIRVEPYIAGKTQLNGHWQLYAKLTGEYASLQSETSHGYRTQNQYLKPLLKLSHSGLNGMQSTFNFQLMVDQLDFDDFIPSQDSNFGREQAGNAQLKPQQTLELSYQFNFESDSDWAVNALLFWQKINDIHEFVKFDAETWGLANAGSANISGTDLKFNLSTPWLMADSQITLQYSFRDASYDDPLSGNRATSWLTPHSGEIELRKDAASYAWGLVFAFPNTETSFYPDEVYQLKNRATADIYAEFSVRHGLTLAVEINNLFGGEYIYQRDIFMPDRSSSVANHYYSLEHSEPSLILSISGTF
ncbi:hypothetical protein [Rheinheimera sp.]|jgi:hypothetical protein|uniref:hypothetical protein n=1 Tax=Rheinheimera TaxID=67575 RepID=UPI0037C59FB1